MMPDYDEQRFFNFYDMAQDLEGKAKDDEYLVPIRIVKAYKHEKEQDEEKGRDNEKIIVNQAEGSRILDITNSK